MMRLFLLFGYAVFLASTGAAVYGTWGVYDQHRRVTTSQPTKATVLGAHLKRKKVDKFPAYTPIVEYEYTENGQKYRSTATTPTELIGRQEWAEGVIQQFPVGKVVQAYVDPRDSSVAFLIPEYGSEPYITALVGIVFACLGLLMNAEIRAHYGTPVRGRFQEDAGSGLGATPLLERSAKRGYVRISAIVGSVWILLGAALCGHFYSVSTSFDRLFWALAGAYFLGGLYLIAADLYTRWSTRGFGETLIEIDTPQPRLGEPFTVHLSQPIAFTGTLRRMTLQAILERKDKRIWSTDKDSEKEGDAPIYANGAILSADHHVHGNETMRATVTFTLPPILPPSTPPDSKERWHHVWSLRLRASASGGRSLERDYEFTLGGPSSVAPEEALVEEAVGEVWER